MTSTKKYGGRYGTSEDKVESMGKEVGSRKACARGPEAMHEEKIAERIAG